MKQQTVIQGHFAPTHQSRVLGVFRRVSAILLCLAVLAVLLIYGLKVHFEDDINRIAKDSRALNEQNKELQVKLNQLRAYKNVEAAAVGMPHLHRAPTVIEIAPTVHSTFTPLPNPPQEAPPADGY